MLCINQNCNNWIRQVFVMSLPTVLLQAWGKMLYLPISNFWHQNYGVKFGAIMKGVVGGKAHLGGTYLAIRCACSPQWGAHVWKGREELVGITADGEPACLVAPRPKSGSWYLPWFLLGEANSLWWTWLPLCSLWHPGTPCPWWKKLCSLMEWPVVLAWS